MTCAVRVARQASKYVERLPPATQRRIVDRLDQLSVDPFGHHSKPLTNATGRRSARAGDYRITYNVNIDALSVFVSITVARGRAYRTI